MGPLYGAVPAPNNDTVYANFFLDVAQGPQELEEERRLLYVAMTRARDHLHLQLAVRSIQLRVRGGV